MSENETAGNALLQRQLKQDPDFARRWQQNKNRRAIALALARMRSQEQLTQAEVARRAGWRQSHVARLESASGPEPSMVTLARFAQACGQQAGVIFGHTEKEHRFQLESGVGLGPVHIGNKSDAKVDSEPLDQQPLTLKPTTMQYTEEDETLATSGSN